jgi:type I restriction enzyme S subunit
MSALGDICAFENGDRSSNYPTPSSFVESGYPFINAGHLENGQINSVAMNYITPASYERLRGGKIKPGDILFCLRGSLGKFGIVSDDFGAGAIASSLVIVRPKSRNVTREYLGCYFGSSLCAQMIETWSGGAAQPNLGVQDLARFVIALPRSGAEQRAIATALSNVDALLQKLDQLIAKKRDVKQGVMQELVTGDTRLPGFDGTWSPRRLGEVLRVRHGKSQRGVETPNGRFPILATSGEIGRTDTFMYDRPSVLIGRKGTIDCPQYMDLPFWTVDTLFFTEVSNSCVAKFLYYVFNTINWRNYNEASGVPSLNASTIAAIEFLCPEKNEQSAIAAVLSDMDADIVDLDARRDKTRSLKQGMMQELLTGRIRLV